MYFIIYSSSAKGKPGENEFRNLLNQCHRNNPELDITGLLLYNNGQYLQIIEGRKENVQALYQVISQDTRHEQVHILAEGSQIGRNFPDWAMGFKAIAGNQNLALPDFINLNENELFFNANAADAHPALPHLKNFYAQFSSGQEFIQI